MRPPFFERFEKLSRERASLLCVGLDPDPEKIPAGYRRAGPAGILEFLTDVVAATAPLAVAYKPNIAFFEALGVRGWSLFAELITAIRERAPGALVVADAKRGDIGNTAAAYARAFFQELDCDALTVNPYMGDDTLRPFLEYRDRAVIVLCLTSNPGAEKFQNTGEPPLYLRVAGECAKLNAEYGNLWLVVGATRSGEHMQRIAAAAPGLPWLVPGIGAQGGDLAQVLRLTGGRVLINASRSILYASPDRDTVPEAARAAAATLVAQMSQVFDGKPR